MRVSTLILTRALAAVRAEGGGRHGAAPASQPQPVVGPSDDDVLKLHAELKHQLALQVRRPTAVGAAAHRQHRTYMSAQLSASGYGPQHPVAGAGHAGATSAALPAPLSVVCASQERVVSGSLVLADNGRRLGLKILALQQSLRCATTACRARGGRPTSKSPLLNAADSHLFCGVLTPCAN